MRRPLLVLVVVALLGALAGAFLLASPPEAPAPPATSVERPRPRPAPSPARIPDLPVPRRVTGAEIEADPAAAFVADADERRARAALFEVTRRTLAAVDPDTDPERIATRCAPSRTRCRSRTALRGSPGEGEVRRAAEEALALDPDAHATLGEVTVTAAPDGGSVVEIELALDGG